MSSTLFGRCLYCGREWCLLDGKSQCCLSVGLSVCRSVGRSVSRNQSVGKQSVRKEERNVFGQLVRFVIMIRRREAKGSINTGRCQDTRVSQSTPPQY